ncbi:hypothetical protein EV122DRAFT_278204 [Schizophyllum commune]
MSKNDSRCNDCGGTFDGLYRGVRRGDFCCRPEEECGQEHVHRHVYGRPYNDQLVGSYMILQHLWNLGAWYGKGLATQFCLVFPDEWIALETVGVWYTADIINDLDRAALAGAGAIAAITPHPTQWQSEELPDEVNVKDRLKPFYLRIIRSSHHPKLFYATFKTVEKAMHAKSLVDSQNFVVDVFDCTRVDVTTDPELDDILWTQDNLRNLGIRRVLPLQDQMAMRQGMRRRTKQLLFQGAIDAYEFVTATLNNMPGLTPSFVGILVKAQLEGNDERESTPPTPPPKDKRYSIQSQSTNTLVHEDAKSTLSSKSVPSSIPTLPPISTADSGPARRPRRFISPSPSVVSSSLSLVPEGDQHARAAARVEEIYQIEHLVAATAFQVEKQKAKTAEYARRLAVLEERKKECAQGTSDGRATMCSEASGSSFVEPLAYMEEEAVLRQKLWASAAKKNKYTKDLHDLRTELSTKRGDLKFFKDACARARRTVANDSGRCSPVVE